MIVDALKKSILMQAYSTGFKNYSFQQKKFKDIFNIINGFTPLRSDPSLWSNNEVNWFTVDDYNEQGFIINYTNQHISNKAVGKNVNRILPAGTVILCCTSATIGTSAICNIPMATNQQFNGLIPNKGIEVDTKYLYYYTLTLKNKMKSDSTSTTFPFLSVKNLEKYDFPYIDINIQREIANKIDELFLRLDDIKPLEEELNNLKKSLPNMLKKSILLSALKGKLANNNINEFVDEKDLPKSTLKDKPFDIPDNWIWYGHNDLFEIIGGSQPPKSRFSDTCKDGYIQLYQIRDYGPNPQPVYVDKNDVSKFSAKGDIILARYGGSLGKVFWAEAGAYNVALAKVIIKYPKIINKKYLYYYYLADLYQSKVKSGNRSAQAGFSKEDLSNLAFPLPPIEEQERIVVKIEQLLPLCDDIEKLVSE